MNFTAKPDYWSLLGLSPDCNSDELKSAFRREARRWHPDLNGNDINAEERFKLVNEAYAVLSDPRKRAIWEESNDNQYEQIRDPFERGFPDFNDYINTIFGNDLDLEDYDDSREQETESIDHESENDDYSNAQQNLDSDFDWPTRAPVSPPPIQAFEDEETTVDLSTDQALYGTTIELELDDGAIVEVKTPPLAGDGWRLRLERVAQGGKDHYIQLRVQTEEGLRIDGLRVLYRLELLPADAVLGCAVDVPTILGPVTLQVPPGSSSGRLLRLRGRGMELDGRRGDQLVEIAVVLPSEITESERALYQRLQELAIDPENI